MEYSAIFHSVRGRYLSIIEGVTYFLSVPFGVVFLFFSASYELKEVKAVSFGAAAACVITIMIFYPIRRMKIDSVAIAENSLLNKERVAEINSILHSIPKFESVLISVRWFVGIAAALFFSHLAEPAGKVRILSFAVLYVLIFLTNWISAYLAAENSVNPLFMHPAFSEAAPLSEYKAMTFRSKIFCCFSAIVLQLVIPFSFLMYMFSIDLVNFEYLGITLGLFLFFAILLSFFVSRMLLENFSFSVNIIREISEEFSSGNFKLKANSQISRELSDPLNSLRERMIVISDKIRSESEELLKCANRMNLLAEEKKEEVFRQSTSVQEISLVMDELNNITIFIMDKVNEADLQMKTTNSLLSELDQKKLSLLNELQQTEKYVYESAVSVKNNLLVIHSSVKVIQELIDTSLKIGASSEVINEIADRVSLLSINASIEAAKAGEFGRGFSIVAKEISSLGEKTMLNSKEIRAQVQKVTKSADEAKQMIGRILDSFLQISEKIDQTNERIRKVFDLFKEEGRIQSDVLENYRITAELNTLVRLSISEQSETILAISSSVSEVNRRIQDAVELDARISDFASLLKTRSSSLKGEISFFKTGT